MVQIWRKPVGVDCYFQYSQGFTHVRWLAGFFFNSMNTNLNSALLDTGKSYKNHHKFAWFQKMFKMGDDYIMIPATSKHTMMICKNQAPFHSWADYTQVKHFFLEVLVGFLDDIRNIWSFFSEDCLRNPTHGIVFFKMCDVTGSTTVKHISTHTHTHTYIEYTQVICPCLKPRALFFYYRTICKLIMSNEFFRGAPVQFTSTHLSDIGDVFFQQNLITGKNKVSPGTFPGTSNIFHVQHTYMYNLQLLNITRKKSPDLNCGNVWFFPKRSINVTSLLTSVSPRGTASSCFNSGQLLREKTSINQRVNG